MMALIRGLFILVGWVLKESFVILTFPFRIVELRRSEVGFGRCDISVTCDLDAPVTRRLAAGFLLKNWRVVMIQPIACVGKVWYS